MKKIIALSVALLILTGCTAASVDPRQIAFAAKLCAENGGLRSLESHFTSETFVEVRCKNGVTYRGHIKETP